MQQVYGALDLVELFSWDIQPDGQSVGDIVANAFRRQGADIISWGADYLCRLSVHFVSFRDFGKWKVPYRA